MGAEEQFESALVEPDKNLFIQMLTRDVELVPAILDLWDNSVDGALRYVERDDDGNFDYPTLHDLTEGVLTFPDLIRRIDQILDKYGKIKDTASPRLAEIRTQLRKAEGSVSRTLYSILHAAQSEGLVDKDVTPTLRDGRLVVPIAPAMKRRIKGIVHDESSTGKTVFVEPTEVVEANKALVGIDGRLMKTPVGPFTVSVEQEVINFLIPE